MMKYKPATAALLAQRFLEPGDAVLEIGAADGEFTRIYADRVGPSGHVTAVEPHRGSLRALLALTVERPWVTVWDDAVGAEVGTAAFYPDGQEPKMSSLYGRNVQAPARPYVVPVTTIDTLVSGMTQTPAFIHIDAQGAEADILRGATRTLALPIVWIVEVWPAGLHRAGASIADVVRPFEARGYQAESAYGMAVSWPSAYRACNAMPTDLAHLDLVCVPAALRAEASA